MNAIKLKFEKTLNKNYKTILDGSFFVTALVTFAAFLSKLVANSAFSRFFTSYERTEKLYEKSLFGGFVKKCSFLNLHIQKRKLAFARLCENSSILVYLQKMQRQFLCLSLRSLGEGFFCFGLFTFVVQLMNFTVHPDTAFLTLHTIIGISFFFVSLLMLPVKSSIASLISESRMMSFVLFKLFPFDKTKLSDYRAKKGGHTIPILLGLVCGSATFFVNPVYVLAGFVAIIGVSVLLSSPETGVLLLFFSLPFLPTMALLGLLIMTFVSYLLKLSRGKRVIKIQLLDVLILFFMAILVFGGVISFGKLGSIPPTLVYLVFLSSYFLVKNLIRSIELTHKCVQLIFISGALVSLYGVYQNFFGGTDSTWIDTDMFSSIESRVVSTLENPNVLGEYLILIIPIFIAFFFVLKGLPFKLSTMAVSGVSALCLVYTWSRGAWLGFMFSVALLLLLYNQKAMIAVALGIISIPVLPFILPDSIISRFTSIGNLADSSTSYRLSIWEASLDLIHDFFWGGIGIGHSAFANVYPKYSYSGIEAAPHSHNLFMQLTVEMGIFTLVFYLIIMVVFVQMCVSFITDKNGSDRSMKLLCLGGLCGTIAFNIQGLTDYTWYNYRVFLMFWLIFGLCVAAIGNSKNEYVPVTAHIAVRQEGAMYEKEDLQ